MKQVHTLLNRSSTITRFKTVLSLNMLSLQKTERTNVAVRWTLLIKLY